jgi:hypothetical protein
MLPRKRPRTHSAPNSNGSAGLLLPKQRRRGTEGRATSPRMATVILTKRNTPFSSNEINALHTSVRAGRLSGRDSPSPGASDARQTARHFALTANGTELRGVAHLSPISQVRSLILHFAFGLREAIADGVADQTHAMTLGIALKFNAVSFARAAGTGHVEEDRHHAQAGTGFVRQ